MIRPGPEKHGVWPNLSLDNALLILGGDEQMEILVIFLVTFAANVASAFVVKAIEEKKKPRR